MGDEEVSDDNLFDETSHLDGVGDEGKEEPTMILDEPTMLLDEPTMEGLNLFEDETPTPEKNNKNAAKNKNVQAASFGEIQDEGSKISPRSLDFILDVTLQVSVRLGATKILIRDLLQLTHGSVVELDKLAGEPMDVLINDKLIARGEVVVVNEKFGIRLTDILSHPDRIKLLK